MLSLFDLNWALVLRCSPPMRLFSLWNLNSSLRRSWKNMPLAKR